MKFNKKIMENNSRETQVEGYFIKHLTSIPEYTLLNIKIM